MLANADNITPEYKSSLFQRHPDARGATLGLASCCEPGLNVIPSQTEISSL